MNQKTKTLIRSFAFFLLFSITVFSIQSFAAFTPPSGAPLTNNVPAPLNSGSSLQKKEGGLIIEFFRVIGLTLLGGNLEVAGTVKILGGNPGADKVLASDATGLASWRDPSTLGIGGGGITGIVPVTQGGTGLSTIPANSIWVSNTKDVVTTLTPAAGNSIRISASGSGWESFMPLTSSTNGGTVNTLSKFTGPHSLGDSGITDNGTLITANSPFKVGSNLVLSTVVMSNIVGNVNDLQIPDGAFVQINSFSNAPHTIHGIGGTKTHGRIVYLNNQSGATNFIIKHNSSAASPSNRVYMPNNQDLNLGPDETVVLLYDTGYPGTDGWRALVIPTP